MEHYVRNRDVAAGQISSRNREHLAKQARLTQTDLQNLQRGTRNVNPGQTNVVASRPPIFTASELTEPSSNSGEEHGDASGWDGFSPDHVSAQLKPGGLREYVDRSVLPAYAEKADGSNQINELSREQSGSETSGEDDSDANVPINDTHVLSSVINEYERHPGRVQGFANSFDSDLDLESYPETTSGQLTDGKDSRLGDFESGHGKRGNQLQEDQGPFKFSLPESLRSEQPPLNNSWKGAVSNTGSPQQMQSHADAYNQQNIRNYHASKHKRKEGSPRVVKFARKPFLPTHVPTVKAGEEISRAHSVPPVTPQPPRSASPRTGLQSFQRPFNDPQNPKTDRELIHRPGSLPNALKVTTDNSQGGLDYEESTLYNMEYATLMAQSFDHVPVSKSKVELEGESSTLDERLRAMSTRSLNEQQEFFTTLSLEEWEQSGKWFTDRFTELMQKLQRSRRDRRVLAQLYEDEVSDRYDAVIKEQQSLDEALKGMKNSGNKVLLQNTPRKR